ncbi:MAG: hypothetical protein U9R21_08695, partial [Candidatus Thermoplasmatota archaeon]|nr:hypothetical protein [Candidatus Thermoplasmatota archaeon]
ICIQKNAQTAPDNFVIVHDHYADNFFRGHLIFPSSIVQINITLFVTTQPLEINGVVPKKWTRAKR